MRSTICSIALAVTWILPLSLSAAPVSLPHVFQNGNVADADQVNDNFNAVATAIDDNDSRVAALEATVASLQDMITSLQAALAATDGGAMVLDNRVSQLESSPVLGLMPFMHIELNPIHGLPGPHVIFSGVNVHGQSGTGMTNDGAGRVPSGLGNLVVGYNEPPPGLSAGDRQGAHNLIVGPEHIYPSAGGFVAGFENAIVGPSSSVTGGQGNVASNFAASVSGGQRNAASGDFSSVSGGQDNGAIGNSAHVSGGQLNAANAIGSSVNGGQHNQANHDFATVNGGNFNTASGNSASVNGGQNNDAVGDFSSISSGSGIVLSGPGESDISALQLDLTMLQGNKALMLDPYINIDPNPIHDLLGPQVIFEGANVHIRSGSGGTEDGGSPTGLGNLIIGYNEPPAVLSPGERGGAHNLVIGREHRYISHGGLLAGEENTLFGPAATVSGGKLNIAGAPYASISGGESNSASGNVSSISGGEMNIASGQGASVSGGKLNDASGPLSSISGGDNNRAMGDKASVLGGMLNEASGETATVSGGDRNTANARFASISGGAQNIAGTDGNTPCTGLNGEAAAVSGGTSNIACGERSVVSGGTNNTAANNDATVSGDSGRVAIGTGEHLP